MTCAHKTDLLVTKYHTAFGLLTRMSILCPPNFHHVDLTVRCLSEWPVTAVLYRNPCLPAEGRFEYAYALRERAQSTPTSALAN